MCCYKSRFVCSLLLRRDISQGSVATHLRCGEIFSDNITANFVLILTVKQFENRSIFNKVIGHTKNCATFGQTCTLRKNLMSFGPIAPEISTLDCVIFGTNLRKSVKQMYRSEIPASAIPETLLLTAIGRAEYTLALDTNFLVLPTRQTCPKGYIFCRCFFFIFYYLFFLMVDFLDPVAQYLMN